MAFTFKKLSCKCLPYLFAFSWAFPVYSQSSFYDGASVTKIQMTSIEPIPPSQMAQQTNPSNTDAGSGRINYLGIGGTLGLSDEGETPLGEGGFSIVGRISLTENISIHTSSLLGDAGLLSVALTGGSPIRAQSNDRTLFFPFLGAGVAVETEEFDTVDLHATGGVDVPLGSTVTGTAKVNATFAEDGTDVGLTIGVGIDIFDLIF